MNMTKTSEQDRNKLSLVASLMDVWTREDNQAYIEEAKRKEDMFFRMADEIVRLTDMINGRNQHIATLVGEMNTMGHTIESYQLASETMQRTIILNNQHMNVTIPERRYEHDFAVDNLGVTHVVIRERGEENRWSTDEELEDSELDGEGLNDEEMDEIVANMDV